MWSCPAPRKWTEPIVKTRFEGNPDYETEGKILGKYIAENYDGKKLGICWPERRLRRGRQQGLRAGIEGSNVQIVAIEKYESSAADVTAQTQRLKNAGAEVVAVYAMPATGRQLWSRRPGRS